MDALFGLPRKKSAGKSVRELVHGHLFFKEQQSVDEFVESAPSRRTSLKVHNPHSLKPRKRHAGSASILIEDSSSSDDDNDRPAKAHKNKKRIVVDFTIRVINPERKRDAKTFILKGIELKTFGTVKRYWSNLGRMWSVSFFRGGRKKASRHSL